MSSKASLQLPQSTRGQAKRSFVFSYLIERFWELFVQRARPPAQRSFTDGGRSCVRNCQTVLRDSHSVLRLVGRRRGHLMLRRLAFIFVRTCQALAPRLPKSRPCHRVLFFGLAAASLPWGFRSHYCIPGCKS